MAANAFLPEELILEIVARLPVKSAGRCRCVSTRWRSLFSDPYFAKSHFHLAPKHVAIIFLDIIKLKTLGFDLSDTTLIEEDSLVLRDLNAPFYHRSSKFLGSCNGLVALLLYQPVTRKEHFAIWNPSTKFFKILPYPSYIDKVLEWGFGYVSATDEYKLVVGNQIFSSKTETWKPMKRSPVSGGIGEFCNTIGVFYRGALHWLDCRQKYRTHHLYAFDLEEENFSIMKLPAALQKLDLINRCLQLGVTCEGYLYAMVQSLVCDWTYYVIDFWVMKEYGNSDSWTRSFGVKIPKRENWCLSVESILVSETSAFVRNNVARPEKLTSTCHYRNEEENSDIYMIDCDARTMIVYQESLYVV